MVENRYQSLCAILTITVSSKITVIIIVRCFSSSNFTKIRFRLGTRWGSLQHSPRPHSLPLLLYVLLDAFSVSISAPRTSVHLSPRSHVGARRCGVRRAHQMVNPTLQNPQTIQWTYVAIVACSCVHH